LNLTVCLFFSAYCCFLS